MFKALFRLFAGSEEGGISPFRSIAGIIILVLAGSLFAIFYTNTVEIWEVESASMVPVLEVGDRLVKMRTKNVQKGDLVVFYSYDDPETPMVKRLVAVEGDTVEVLDGTLYVNDEQMYPMIRYLQYPVPRNEKWKIEEGQIFVAGDNQRLSEDSRFFGPIDLEQVDGKVIYIIGPSERRGFIYREYPPPDPDEYLASL